MSFRLPENVLEIARTLDSHGYKAFVVGGAIRNIYAGLGETDYDFATDAPVHEVSRIFRRVIPTGIDHGTVTVILGKEHFEITTFRIDGKYSDSRHPDTVKFSVNIYDDLDRRDFTINGIAYDPLSHAIVDPHDGKTDIKQKIIRTIGNPLDRFTEDPLRILRAFRFASQLGFRVEKSTLDAISDNAKKISMVSAERIRDEFIKLIGGKNATDTLLLMDSAGVLELLLPELEATKGIKQKGYHDFDVFHHCVYSAEWAPRDNTVLILAALLHDIGKPSTLDYKDNQPVFYRHESAGSQIAGKILERLKFPNRLIGDVTHLIAEHMFHYVPEWSDGAVRRFIARVGYEHIDNLFALRRCDEYGFSRRPVDSPSLYELKKRIEKIIKSEDATSLAELKVNGTILHDKLGIPKSRAMGIVLNELLETVLDDPSMNTKDKLLTLAGNFYRKINR